MNKCFILFFSIFILSFLYSQDLNYAWSDYNWYDYELNKLRGKIKEYNNISYYVNNKNGQLDKNKIIGKKTLKINNYGKISEGNEYINDEAKKSYLEYFYIYDNYNRIIKASFFDENKKIKKKYLFFYDNSSDYRTKEEYYESEDKLLSQKIYKYTNNYKNVEILHYDDSNILIKFIKENIYFNENQKEIKYEYDYNYGKLIISIYMIYNYDVNGNIIKVISYNKENSILNNYNGIDTFNFTYDNNKIIYSSDVYFGGKLQWSSIYTYFNDRYECINYNPDGRKNIINIYFTDKNNNIILWEQYLFEKDGSKKLIHYEESTFEYY